jgi:uncharacterized protein YwqG
VETGPHSDADTIRRIFERHGGVEIWPEVEKLVRPGITITAVWAKGRPKRQPIGTSRFGGVPDMPAGEPWPTRQGVPMEFVAQIDCGDVGPLSNGLLPGAGHLFFFRSTQWAFSDMSKECCRVIYADASQELIPATAPKVPYEDEFAGSTVAPRVYEPTERLAFAAFPAVPIPHADDVKWNKTLKAAYAAVAGNADSELPPQVPYDRDHQMLGYYPEPDYCGVIKPKDVRLFTVASQEPFTWGDIDRLSFVVTAAELKKRDFRKTRLYLKLG